MSTTASHHRPPRTIRLPGLILICPNAHRHIRLRLALGLLFDRPTVCPICGLHARPERSGAR